jgi:hypothetical protein
MLAFLADENFHGRIVRGLLRRQPELSILRVQDIQALTGADDPAVLEWAAPEGRIVLTHDAATVTRFAYERVQAGLSMTGVFEVSRTMPVRAAIAERLLAAVCSLEGEWEGQVRYFPL